jgi:hypothetical protein
VQSPLRGMGELPCSPLFALSKLFARRSKGGNEKQGLGSIVVVLRSDKDRLSTGAIEPAA